MIPEVKKICNDILSLKIHGAEAVAIAGCHALELTDSIEKRSKLFAGYDHLKIMSVSNEDIVLFKSVTERTDDTNDVASIVGTSKINWQIILDECKQQSKERIWFGSLLNKLAELKEKHGIDAPITAELNKLDKANLLREAYNRRFHAGAERGKAISELKKIGFAKRDLKNAGIK